jgi:hypothetical protein
VLRVALDRKKVAKEKKDVKRKISDMLAQKRPVKRLARKCW